MHDELIQAAVAAPSSHNTQPWLFGVHDGAIELFADRRRALPVNDPFDRELTISCGAALFNLRVASAARDLATRVRFHDEGDRLATVSLGVGAVESAIAPLASSIEKRFTTREPFKPVELDAELLDRMKEAVAAEGAKLSILDEGDRAFAAGLVAEGDEAQFASSSWRRELASWLHPRRSGDGLAMSPWVVPFSRLAVRNFDFGDKIGEDDEKLAVDAPELVLLTTVTDDRFDWLRAGQALERALLIACADDVQAGYLNQPCQLDSLRSRLAKKLSPTAFPQVLIRLGQASPPHERAPRRPTEDVVLKQISGEA